MLKEGKLSDEKEDGEYRCIFKDLYLDYNDSNEKPVYTIKVDVVFFEYK